MSKALDTVAASDFTMVRDDDNQVITVKSASLDATDKTQVKLSVYTSLTDAKTYTVTYTAADEAKTQSSAKVTVTDGTVADVAITPVEITANSETPIYYQTLDASGVVISEKPVRSPETKVEVSCDTQFGTLDESNSKLILYNVGDTAKFTVTYHTYKYDATTGAELDVIKKEFTVSAVKDANVVAQYDYTVATEKPYDWSKVTPVKTVALGDGNDGFDDRYAYFMIRNQKGDDVTASCGYSVESSDNSKVVADGYVADGVLLKPVSTGSAYLMIKDGDGKVVQTLPITVGEKRKLSVFKLDKNSVTIATDTAVAVAKSYVEVTAKDQYGEDISVGLVASERTKNSGVKINENYTYGKTMQISAGGASANKTGVYTITATDNRNNSMTTTLNVTTKAPSGSNTYSVVFLDPNSNANAADYKVVSSVDTTVDESKSKNNPAKATATSKAVIAKVVVRNNGVIVDELSSWAGGQVTCSAVKVTRNSDNTVLYSAISDGAVKKISVSSPAIDYDTATSAALQGYVGVGTDADVNISIVNAPAVNTIDVDNPVLKYLTPATYTVQYEMKINGTTYKPYATLTVTDKQTSAKASILNTNAGTNKFSDIMNNTNYANFYYGDVQLKSGEYKYVSADYTINGTGKNVYVKSVTLNVKAASSENFFQLSLPVNKTFTTDNATWVKGDF